MTRKRDDPGEALRALLEPHGLDPAVVRAVILANLVDAEGIAPLIGLSSADSVRTYASTRTDFPRPVLPPDPEARPRSNRWYWRPDVLAWRAANQRGPGRPPASPTVTPPP